MLKSSVEAPASTAGALLLVVAFAALALRLPLGVDLGDEAYYAVFVQGWLQSGVSRSPFLMVHQTAALIVYPLTRLYVWLQGDAQGLVLFLRCIYLAMTTLTAWTVWCAARWMTGPGHSALMAACVLLYIPFQLPAPSYNTVGLCGLVAGEALFVCALLRAEPGRSNRSTAALAGLALGMSCVAYPPMGLAVVSLFAFVGLAPAWRAQRSAYLKQVMVAASVMSMCCLALLLAHTPSHWLEIVGFTSAFNQVAAGLPIKLAAASDALQKHPLMLLALVLAMFASCARAVTATTWQRVGDLALVLALAAGALQYEACFYSRSHDLILIAAVAHVVPAWRACFYATDARGALLGACVLASFVGGLITAAAAFNGFFNFAIGGFAAACMGMLLPMVGRQDFLLRRTGLALALLCCVFSYESLTRFYGQVVPVSYLDSLPLTEGIFKGLRTDRDQAIFISRMQNALEPLRGCGGRLAVLGTGPGLYLLGMGFEPAALAPWSFPGKQANAASRSIDAYYQANPADIIVLNQWQWATPLTAGEKQLLQAYRVQEEIRSGIHHASIYRRASMTESARELALGCARPPKMNKLP